MDVIKMSDVDKCRKKEGIGCGAAHFRFLLQGLDLVVFFMVG